VANREPRSLRKQSQRDCVLQPKVARNELPWVIVQQSTNRNAVAAILFSFGGHVTLATTPLGLVILFLPFPRVARSSQPWALGHSPVGAEDSDRSTGRKMKAHDGEMYIPCRVRFQTKLKLDPTFCLLGLQPNKARMLQSSGGDLFQHRIQLFVVHET
jgi:hypothetical protein